MRFIELQGAHGRRNGVAVVPLGGETSDAMGLTKSAQEAARAFHYSTLLLVNRDRILGWSFASPAGPLATVELDGRAVLSRYATNVADLDKAGESYLSGLVEDWLEDLRSHWRHAPGEVPGERQLEAFGLFDHLGAAEAPAAAS